MTEGLPLKFKTKIFRLAHLINMHYAEIPVTVIKKMGGKFSKRLICSVNNEISFQCGIVALGEGKGYISINASRMKKLGLKKGSTVTIELKKDDSKYGMEMPVELLELFRQDKSGKNRFDKLKPGMQRYILYYVSQVKNPQLRIDRSILLIENLKKTTSGKETFRALLGKEN